LYHFLFIMVGMKYKEEETMKRYGYVRVSAKDQNPERQLLAMREAAEGAGMSYSTFYRRSLEKEGREVKR